MIDLGGLDIVYERSLETGGGSYHDLLPSTFVLNAFGRVVRCLTLPKLIEVKRAAGASHRAAASGTSSAR